MTRDQVHAQLNNHWAWRQLPLEQRHTLADAAARDIRAGSTPGAALQRARDAATAAPGLVMPADGGGTW